MSIFPSLFSACYGGYLRRCLHDTGATFVPARDHPGSLTWLCIHSHDTTRKCHSGMTHTDASSPRLLHRREDFIPVRNPATVSCKRRTTSRFGIKLTSRWTGNWNGWPKSSSHPGKELAPGRVFSCKQPLSLHPQTMEVNHIDLKV